MQPSSLSSAVPAPKRAQRDGTLNCDDRRARRIAEAERLGLAWPPPRNFGSGSGAGKLSGQTMWEEVLFKSLQKDDFDSLARLDDKTFPHGGARVPL